VTGSARSEALPDIPKIGEFVQGYEANGWFGCGAPRATPAEIIDKLNNEMNAGLVDPKLKARFADLGATERRPTFHQFHSRMTVQSR
jgi:tripartite-type tricarboxylate transporter receptor subunit TctC